jgi:hypothetical protein
MTPRDYARLQQREALLSGQAQPPDAPRRDNSLYVL